VVKLISQLVVRLLGQPDRLRRVLRHPEILSRDR
jgi:hypothetical protein